MLSVHPVVLCVLGSCFRPGLSRCNWRGLGSILSNTNKGKSTPGAGCQDFTLQITYYEQLVISGNRLFLCTHKNVCVEGDSALCTWFSSFWWFTKTLQHSPGPWKSSSMSVFLFTTDGRRNREISKTQERQLQWCGHWATTVLVNRKARLAHCWISSLSNGQKIWVITKQ